MLNTKDWFTDFLHAQPDTLVADRDWLYKLHGIKSGAQFSLRLISDYYADLHLPVLVVRHDNLRILDELDVAAQMQEMRRSLRGAARRLLTVVVPATECTLNEARYGLYLGKYGTRVRTAAETAALLKFFAPGICDNPGAIKDLHEERDAWQLLTRTHLSAQLTCQDFDVLRRVGASWQPVELKRFSARIQTWMPYLDDVPNFRALGAAAEALRMHTPLCIGYRNCAERSQLVAVHRVLRAGDTAIDGKRCVTTASSVWDAEPWDAYVSHNRRRPKN